MKKYISLLLLFFSVNAFCRPTGDAKTDTASNQISILTWNVKLLPRGATFLHHHPIIRARLIPQKMIETGADVIVFQECFDGKADRILRNKLKAVYPYNMGYKNRRLFAYKRAGGVLMFSKYPLKELESITYTQLKGVDKVAHKGAMLVEVEHPAKKFQVLGTHMQAGGNKDLKISEYKDAGELLKRHEQTGEPQFACGDFNTHKVDTVLYPKLVEALRCEDGDICSELKFTTDHLLNDMETYRPDKRSVIDYVFVKPNGCTPTNTTRKVIRYEQQWDKTHKDLSDHFAVILRTNL